MTALHDRLAGICAAMPPGSAVQLPVDVVRAWLDEDDTHTTDAVPSPAPEGWRTRIWTCPPDVRLGVAELVEATGRSEDWVYRSVNAKVAKKKGREPLPCDKLDGVLVFEAGVVREWLRRSAIVVNPNGHRRLRRT